MEDPTIFGYYGLLPARNRNCIPFLSHRHVCSGCHAMFPSSVTTYKPLSAKASISYCPSMEDGSSFKNADRTTLKQAEFPLGSGTPEGTTVNEYSQPEQQHPSKLPKSQHPQKDAGEAQRTSTKAWVPLSFV